MIKIYYFTGTGNSLWSAKRIAQIAGEHNEPCELHNIGHELQNSKIVIEADAVVLIFPSYAYGPPLAVNRFVKKAVFKTPYVASLVTYGSSPLGTLGILGRVLKTKKGIGKMFFYRIPCVENYLALFGPPKTKTMEIRLLMQEKASEEAAIAIIERRENKVKTFTPFSSFVSWVFTFLALKIFYALYKVSKKCNGCGVCKKICPVSAIEIKKGKPHFTKRCEHCQSCVNICPLRAIQFGRVRFGAMGYCHPNIDIADLST